MQNTLISEILIKQNKRVCTSRDIHEIMPGEKLFSIISRLINANWIVPVGFRGVYYVLDAEERSRSFFKLGNFQILIKTLNRVFEKEWYFGRITSLSLLGKIQQPVSTYYILNKKFSRRFDSRLLGKVVLQKTSGTISGGCGILTKKYKDDFYRVCSVERNLADYLYGYVHRPADKEQIIEMYHKYLPDREDMLDIIIKCYPRLSAIKMKTVLKEVYG